MDQHDASFKHALPANDTVADVAARSELLSRVKALPARPETAGTSCPALDTELRALILSAALDRLAHGLVVVDGDGRLLLCNAAARAMLDAGQGLKLVQGRVTATLAGESRRLHALLDGALSGRATRSEAMLVHGAAPSTYGVTVESTGAACRQRSGAAATLYITDLAARPSQLSSARLQAMFGFTPAETRIAVGIADGDSVHAVAAKVGVTYESARFTLKRVYEKSGVHKQGELVALIRSALPPLRGADTGDVP